VADILADVLGVDIPVEHDPAADVLGVDIPVEDAYPAAGSPGVDSLEEGSLEEDSLEEDSPGVDSPAVVGVGVDNLVAGTLEADKTGLGRKTVVASLDGDCGSFEVGEDVECAADQRSDELVGEINWTGQACLSGPWCQSGQRGSKRG
jgi:hypothetical protein